MNPGPHTASASEPPQLLWRGDVARLVGLPLHTLTWWVYGFRPSRRYTRFEVRRRNGGAARVIHAPIKPIKDIQRTLATTLAQCYEPPPNVHGFTPGRSPVTNAQQHQRKRWVLKIDLEDFFPTINFGRVRGLFLARPFEYPEEVATLLAQICCHNNELPQGAPTSPIVSNFICRRLDAQLARLARMERCHYTRYADDIAFSTDRTRFPALLAAPQPGSIPVLGDRLREVVHSNGFRINEPKTRLMRHTQRQRVTGLVVNEKVNVSREYVRGIRAALYVWDRYGESEAVRSFNRANGLRSWPPGKPDPRFRRVIAGRVQHVGRVTGWSNHRYRHLAGVLHKLDPSFSPRTLKTLHATQRVRMYAEGRTDLLHLTAALEHFQASGEFPFLEFEVVDESDAGSDSQLLDRCKGLAMTFQETPCICVFDRDNDEILRKAVGAEDARDYGNRVAAVAIATPPWRVDQKICIELLYQNDDIRLPDQSGRRLYLREEFDPETGRHESEAVYTLEPRRRTLVREEVLTFKDGTSVAMSKVAFADAIAGRTGPYSAVTFEGFRRTLEIVQETLIRLVSPTPPKPS